MPDYTALFTGATADGPPELQRKNNPYRILLVDDEPNVLKALKRVFFEENYLVDTASSGLEAMELLAAKPYHLIISDHRMPHMNGAELLSRIRNTYPDTIRIMLTGYADTQAVMGAVKDGAVYRFILKPWNDDDLRVTVSLALEQYDLIQKNRALEAEKKEQSKEQKAFNKLAVASRSKLATLLYRRKLLTDQQLQELHRQQQRRKTNMLKLILDHDWVSENKIYKTLLEEKLAEVVALPEFQVDPRVTELIPRHFCEQQWVLPLKLQGRHRLLLAMADPTDQEMINDLGFITGLGIQPALAPADEIKGKIAAVYGERKGSLSFEEIATVMSTGLEPLDSVEVVIEEEDARSLDDLLKATEEPPAIRLVNAVIIEAVRLNASDVHIQPRVKSVMVRYRIDGVLSDKIEIPHELHSPLVSRIKIMSELDISERRRPQDGRITVKTPMKIMDMRISFVPTINGEKVVMRLLDRSAAILRLNELGFSGTNLSRLLRVIARPQGMVLATGPTGSGKTTTLYSLLQHDATSAKNYVTIEDPVEYYLDMASQIAVREKIGLDFPTILRSMLRQDPDVILIGEIRDLETAEVAFHSALTGHQVFSTLHTNSAVETLARLVDLGLKPTIIASALNAIISQRLVRRICVHCREPVTPDTKVLKMLGPLFTEQTAMKFFQGRGCKHCRHTGNHGRVAVLELLILTDEIKELLCEETSTTTIKRVAFVGNESSAMIGDARDKVAQGVISVDEVLRVLGPQVF